MQISRKQLIQPYYLENCALGAFKMLFFLCSVLFIWSIPSVPVTFLMFHLFLPIFSHVSPLVFCDHSNRKAAPLWKKRTPRGPPLSSCSEGRMRRRKELREYVWIKPPPLRTLDPTASPSRPLGGAVGLHENCRAVVWSLMLHYAWPLCDSTRWLLMQMSCFRVAAEKISTQKLFVVSCLQMLWARTPTDTLEYILSIT